MSSFYDSQIKSPSLTQIDQDEITASEKLEKKVTSTYPILNNKKYSLSSSSYYANRSVTTTNSVQSMENETTRINILQKKNNKPFYFSIDNQNVKRNSN